MRHAARSTAYAALGALGGFALLRWLHRAQVPILCYHSVVDLPVPALLAGTGLHIPLAEFERQMRFIARRYRVLRLEEVAARLVRDGRLPERALVITFDDGYANNLELALPVLESLNFPATMFLATDYIGRERLYWWDELALLLTGATGRTFSAAGWGTLDLTSQSGVQHALARGHALLATAGLHERRVLLDALGAQSEPVPDAWLQRLRPADWNECRAAAARVGYGGHTASHRLLDGITVDTAIADCQRCREALRVELGLGGELPFCYPQGRFTEPVKRFLPALGFSTAVWATDVRAAERLVHTQADPLQLPRIGVHSAMDVRVLAANAAGMRSLIGRVVG